jgi:hypothetical protein
MTLVRDHKTKRMVGTLGYRVRQINDKDGLSERGKHVGFFPKSYHDPVSLIWTPGIGVKVNKMLGPKSLVRINGATFGLLFADMSEGDRKAAEKKVRGLEPWAEKPPPLDFRGGPIPRRNAQIRLFLDGRPKGCKCPSCEVVKAFLGHLDVDGELPRA